MNSLDIFTNQYFEAIRTPALTEFMYLLTTLFDVSISSLLVCACVAILIGIIREKKYALLFMGAIISQAIIVYLLKIFFSVSRPVGAVMEAFGNSFPSYHATVAAVFFIMLMYIFDSHLKKNGRILFNTFCIIMIILVASSRLYLGVHWLSDVLAGIVLGSAISYVSILIFKKIK